MDSSAVSHKGWLMPKALCLIGLVFSVLVALIFLADIALGMSGSESAPLRMTSLVMDILFIVASLGLAYAAWTTYREQK
ncbi:MAG: hypothetical protein U0930_14010 [Pirellulales bacterium]